jgi:hypothetical protein
MKKSIFLVVILVLFASKGFANLKENVPSGLFLSGNFGLCSYDNLAMAKNHPFVDSNLIVSHGGSWCGLKAEYTYSIVDVRTSYGILSPWAIIIRGQDTIIDSVYSMWATYMPLTVGIHTLPAKWPVQIVPEVGFFYDHEWIEKNDGKNICIQMS